MSDAVIHPYPVHLNTHPFGKDSNHFHTDMAFAAVTSHAPMGKPQAGESKTSRLFTRDDIMNLPAKLINDNVRTSCLFVFDECLKHWERVPASSFKI